MNIISRNTEIKLLERIYDSDKAEFLAIYGRRRVGKTYLIRSFFAEKECKFFSVMGTKDSSYQDQINHFTQRIGEVFLGGVIPQTKKTWDETFQTLRNVIQQLPQTEKVVIFLDELPWLATKRSKLLQVIDYYWNQYWSLESRIKLIVCGSSASWIINKIVNNKGGLYNRVTETIHLQPFTLSETEQYLAANKINLQRKQIAELYMATGGIPFYLSKAVPGYSSTQLVEILAFSPKALLLNEFDALFESLFDYSDSYIEIIKAIADNREGIGQEMLFKKLTKTPKGATSIERMKALEDAGFIMSFIPHFHKKKGIYYRVIDEYVLFYLYWIAPLKKTKLVQSVEKGYWKTLSQTAKWFSWSGYAFEALCYKHIKQIRKALDLSPTAIPSSWRYMPKDKSKDTGAQIDLLFDRDDNCITICEIKFGNNPFEITKDYAENLKYKVETFRKITATDKQLFIVLISANGVKKNKYYDELIGSVVTIDDLFQRDS